VALPAPKMFHPRRGPAHRRQYRQAAGVTARFAAVKRGVTRLWRDTHHAAPCRLVFQLRTYCCNTVNRRFGPADLIVASGTEKQLESHRREITALFCDLAALPASLKVPTQKM
jgi:hypothetical protein